MIMQVDCLSSKTQTRQYLWIREGTIRPTTVGKQILRMR